MNLIEQYTDVKVPCIRFGIDRIIGGGGGQHFGPPDLCPTTRNNRMENILQPLNEIFHRLSSYHYYKY